MRLDVVTKTILVVAGIVIVLTGLRHSGEFLLPVLTALFLGVISAPAAHFLEHRLRVPWALAILLTLVLDLAMLAGFIALLGSSVAGLHQAVPRYQSRLVSLAHDGVEQLRDLGVAMGDDPIRDIREARMISLLEDLLGRLAEAVSNTVLVSLLLAFLMFETRVAREKLAILLGRGSAHFERMTEAAKEVQRYLVVKTVLSVLTGVISGCWAAVCGVDFPLLWGLLTFVFNYIPSIGPAISVIPPTLIALVQLGPGAAAVVATGHLTIGFVIGNLLEPRMMGQTLGLSTLVVFLSMFFWGWMWGPVGALYAVPLTMLVRAAMESFEETRWLAVLLGSSEWVEQKRRAWGWQTAGERAGGLPPPSPPPPPRVASSPGSLPAPLEVPKRPKTSDEAA